FLGESVFLIAAALLTRPCRAFIFLLRGKLHQESASEAGQLSIQCNDIEREMSGVEHVQKNQSLKQKDKELIWHAMKGA
ncbi:hypothetical protein SB658_27475, partial [Bacillus sp. SIMBA_008]